MKEPPLPHHSTAGVEPESLRSYAEGLGWIPVEGIPAPIAVLHRPDSDLHQVQIPLDRSFVDYAEGVAIAVERLAAFENRPACEVLEHVLEGEVDLLKIEGTTGPEVAPGRAGAWTEAAGRILDAFAREFVEKAGLPFDAAADYSGGCRLIRAEAGGRFSLRIACPIHVPRVSGPEPFGRAVTKGMMSSLAAQVTRREAGSAGSPPPFGVEVAKALLGLEPLDRPRFSVRWRPRAGDRPPEVPEEVRFGPQWEAGLRLLIWSLEETPLLGEVSFGPVHIVRTPSYFPVDDVAATRGGSPLPYSNAEIRTLLAELEVDIARMVAGEPSRKAGLARSFQDLSGFVKNPALDSMLWRRSRADLYRRVFRHGELGRASLRLLYKLDRWFGS